MRVSSFALSPKSVILASLLVLSGCCTAPPLRQAISSDGIADVQWEIKRQIGIYDAWRVQNNDAEKAEQAKHTYICGAGSINFDISSIKVALTTTDENTSGPKASGKTTGTVVFKPNIGDTNDATNSQELDYTLWPTDDELAKALSQPVSQDDIDHAPLAKALIDLRKGLIKAAQANPPEKTAATKKVWPKVCFTDYSPDKPSGDSGYQFTLQVKLVVDKTYGLEIDVWLIDISDSSEKKSTSGNTLTVTFAQTGVKDLQVFVDEVGKQCNFANLTTDGKCVIATHVWQLVRSPASEQHAKANEIKAEVEALCKLPSTDDCIRMKALSELAKKYYQSGIGINAIDAGVK